jgi:hypothetical protein
MMVSAHPLTYVTFIGLLACTGMRSAQPGT